VRDLLFYVADGNMREAIRGFMERDALQHRVGCAAIEFDARADIKVAKGQNDPGVFTRGHELLRPFMGEYQHVVVIVDEEWEGSPGADAIRDQLQAHLRATGWEDTGLALVVRPEADVWLWTDTDHTANALGWANWGRLSAALQEKHWLEADAIKPERPKEAAEWALRKGPETIKRPSALYRKVTSKVSATRGTDDPVETLLETIQTRSLVGAAWTPSA